jgi:hypothetical protein
MMQELFSKFSGDDLIGLVAVGGGLMIGLIIAVTAIIAQSWQRVRERQMANTIVLEMLDQGHSAEDIVKVLGAASMEKQTDRVAAAKSRIGAVKERIGAVRERLVGRE